MSNKQTIILAMIVFILVFIVDYFFINKKKLNLINSKGKTKKGKQKKIKNIGELDYLIAKFKLDYKKIKKESTILWISLINSFIIAFVSCIIMLLPVSKIWQMLVAFVLLFSLIYALYELFGRYLKRREKN